ncbi:signal recognition particle protein [Microdochium nivale]|nr:signal recognition particle protein [Microdochium nivale]
MPYFATSQEWLRQSALLLEARPTTTRITTKYNIARPKARKPSKSKPESTEETTTTSSTSATTTTTPKPPRGNLVIKTFDPVSGVTLKYRTTKAAEVGRLVLCLGRLGTRMTGLPGDSADVEVATAGAEDVAMADDAAPAAAAAAAAETPAPAAAAAAVSTDSKTTAGGGGGKGKKKKGKK